jgi:hypothetical protein
MPRSPKTLSSWSSDFACSLCGAQPHRRGGARGTHTNRLYRAQSDVLDKESVSAKSEVPPRAVRSAARDASARAQSILERDLLLIDQRVELEAELPLNLTLANYFLVRSRARLLSAGSLTWLCVRAQACNPKNLHLARRHLLLAEQHDATDHIYSTGFLVRGGAARRGTRKADCTRSHARAEAQHDAGGARGGAAPVRAGLHQPAQRTRAGGGARHRRHCRPGVPRAALACGPNARPNPRSCRCSSSQSSSSCGPPAGASRSSAAASHARWPRHAGSVSLCRPRVRRACSLPRRARPDEDVLQTTPPTSSILRSYAAFLITVCNDTPAGAHCAALAAHGSAIQPHPRAGERLLWRADVLDEQAAAARVTSDTRYPQVLVADVLGAGGQRLDAPVRVQRLQRRARPPRAARYSAAAHCSRPHHPGGCAQENPILVVSAQPGSVGVIEDSNAAVAQLLSHTVDPAVGARAPLTAAGPARSQRVCAA